MVDSRRGGTGQGPRTSIVRALGLQGHRGAPDTASGRTEWFRGVRAIPDSLG